MKKIAIASAFLFVVALSASLLQAETDRIAVTAFVENQVCMGGDFVQVTFSATSRTTVQPIGFRWDFTNNGSFDTARSTDPSATFTFPDETSVTTKVAALNKSQERAEDTITFSTLECQD